MKKEKGFNHVEKRFWLPRWLASIWRQIDDNLKNEN